MSGKGLETSAQQWTLYLKCKTQRHYYGFDFLRHSFARSVILPGPHKGCLRMNAAKITDGKNEISSQFSCRNCYQRDDKVKLYNHKEKKTNWWRKVSNRASWLMWAGSPFSEEVCSHGKGQYEQILLKHCWLLFRRSLPTPLCKSNPAQPMCACRECGRVPN